MVRFAKNPQIRPLVEAKDYPNTEALEHFFNHTERLYKQLGFIRNDAVMLKLRRLYQRAELETNELNLLRGMLTSVEKQIENK
ncbi:tRNA/rRNA methyltransferase [Actinobacillus equuli]|nr:tRNA/rRNA methyltransferase [Actinobacillus equuli]